MKTPMPATAIPQDEATRLRSLAALNVLDSAPEPEFDALVKAAALVCGVPISLISLVDAERQWFKASIGLAGLHEVPREIGFCAHSILDQDLLEIEDASRDPRFAANPLVTGAPGIRFYAGAPLNLLDGTCVGSLCVIDHQPRRLDSTQREILLHLAASAARALEGRRALLVERRLRDLESRATALLRLSVDAIIGVDLDGTVTHWNDAAERMYGYSNRDMVGQSIARIIPADRLATEVDFVHRLTAHPAGLMYETERLRRDGSVIPVSASLTPVLSAEGTLIGVAKIDRDMREHRELVGRLSISEKRLRTLYESTPAMLYSVDAEGRIVAVSDQLLQRLGYTREEVIGHRSYEFMTEASRQYSIQVGWPQFVANGRCDGRELQWVSKSGEIVEVLLSAVMERDAAGAPLRSMTVIEDVTPRRRAEQALNAERQRLINILEGTQAGTWEWNVQTSEVRFNEQWAAIAGHTLDALRPLSLQTWIDLVHPDDLHQSNELLRRHLAGEDAAYECEVRMRHRDGHWVWILSRGRVMTWTADGAPQWMYGTHLDITSRVAERQAIEEVRDRIALATESGGIGVWDFEVATGIATWSDWMYRLYGLPLHTAIENRTYLRYLHPDDRALVKKDMRDAIEHGQPFDHEIRLVWDDGSIHHLRSTARATRDENGKVVRLVGVNWEVTELRRLAAELAEQHELLRVTLQSIGDAVVTTDANGRVNWLNPAAERMSGWLSSEAIGLPFDQVFHVIDEQTRQVIAPSLSTQLQRTPAVGLLHHALLVSRGGEEFSVEDSAAEIRNVESAVLGVVRVFRDVTEKRRLTREMSHRATHDALTGLVNRTEFDARLRRLLQTTQDQGGEHALMYIDLDQFKLVNDSCGHAVGDELLQKVSALLTQSIRSRDTLARLGGDEFAVILEHCSVEQSQRVAQQICQRMDDFRFQHDGRRIRIGTSIGLVPIDDRWTSTAAILQAADTSCYAAKEAGRNRVHLWFDTDLAMRARHGQMAWATRIEQALDEDRFTLFAQRIAPCQGSEGGLHAEVLLRMIEPNGSLAPPSAFLPAAERFSLSARIDRWVLRRTIAWLQTLPPTAQVDMISVNLSGQSIGDRAFHRHAIDTLNAAGPEVVHRLCFEITETAAITNLGDAAVFIDQVRALGVRIALDDFGAGASSFGYLKSLAVDILKIDGQFIKNIIEDPLADAAVRCFIEVAKVVNVKTVAEFVDRREVLARLGEIGIDYVQGFLLHRPEALETLLGSATPAFMALPARGCGTR